MGLFDALRHGQQFTFTGAPIGLVTLPSLGAGELAVPTRKAAKLKDDKNDDEKYEGIFTQQELLLQEKEEIKNLESTYKNELINGIVNGTMTEDEAYKKAVEYETQLANAKYVNAINENRFNVNTERTNQVIENVKTQKLEGENMFDQDDNRIGKTVVNADGEEVLVPMTYKDWQVEVNKVGRDETGRFKEVSAPRLYNKEAYFDLVKDIKLGKTETATGAYVDQEYAIASNRVKTFVKSNTLNINQINDAIQSVRTMLELTPDGIPAAKNQFYKYDDQIMENENFNPMIKREVVDENGKVTIVEKPYKDIPEEERFNEWLLNTTASFLNPQFEKTMTIGQANNTIGGGAVTKPKEEVLGRNAQQATGSHSMSVTKVATSGSAKITGVVNEDKTVTVGDKNISEENYNEYTEIIGKYGTDFNASYKAGLAKFAGDKQKLDEFKSLYQQTVNNSNVYVAKEGQALSDIEYDMKDGQYVKHTNNGRISYYKKSFTLFGLPVVLPVEKEEYELKTSIGLDTKAVHLFLDATDAQTQTTIQYRTTPLTLKEDIYLGSGKPLNEISTVGGNKYNFEGSSNKPILLQRDEVVIYKGVAYDKSQVIIHEDELEKMNATYVVTEEGKRVIKNSSYDDMEEELGVVEYDSNLITPSIESNLPKGLNSDYRIITVFTPTASIDASQVDVGKIEQNKQVVAPITQGKKTISVAVK